MKRLAPLALGTAFGCLLAPAASAGTGPNPDAKMILHLVPVVNRTPVRCFGSVPKTPEATVTAGDLAPQSYYAYVLVTDFNPQRGLAGVQFGISYDDSVNQGVDIYSWQSCALYEWPMDEWPASETGNLLTWNQDDDCQVVAPLVVGYFHLTVHSPDRLKLIPRPVDGMACVAVCGQTASGKHNTVDTLQPENLGWADFGAGKGYNPWDPKQNLIQLRERFGKKKD